MSAVLKGSDAGSDEPVPSLTAMHEADLDEVMAIESAIYSHPWTRGNFGDSLRAGYACMTWRLAHGAGRPLIGYFVLMAAAGEGHLLNLSIAASHQRSGYGRALLRAAAAIATGLGARNLFLEVRPSNEAAQALYRRFGFHKVAVRRGYYPAHGGREDALVLTLPLE
jgi:ribosomal-protein-alanine N-acetyltransferase